MTTTQGRTKEEDDALEAIRVYFSRHPKDLSLDFLRCTYEICLLAGWHPSTKPDMGRVKEDLDEAEKNSKSPYRR